jgi:heat shock protein HslJ
MSPCRTSLVARATLAGACATIALGGAGCGGSGGSETGTPPHTEPTSTAPSPAANHPDDLWGRAFAASSLTEGGKPRPVVGRHGITVTFDRSRTRRMLYWDAGCNRFGARLEITATELHDVGPTAGTLVGCEPQLEKQDRWLGNFFESGPRWRLTGSRLTLTSDGAVIELRETGS